MDHDLLIVGGGINGCAIAREASLLGLTVLLVERDDLAGHTSSASTGLIHGGLRYLESYDFKLVAEALRERERLLRAAPHLIRPLQFVLPQENSIRPWWMVRLGLYLYDRLGGRISLQHSRGLCAGDTAFTAPLRGSARGFVYSDAQVDDARLTLLNAMDAAANGAVIATRTELDSATATARGWTATLSDGRTVTARALVNAAGPWVMDAIARSHGTSRHQVRLVKGSHIVVPRLYDGDHAYLLQLADRRIVFALPWHGRTALGTTDIAVERPEDAVIDPDEVRYLCDAANSHFVCRIEPADVTHSWCGVRALYDDEAGSAQQVTRDYVLELDRAGGSGAPLLSVFGGKITTGRHLAEDAMARLAPLLGVNAHRVTRARIFPGGAIDGFDHFVAQVRATWPFLGEERGLRMAQAYGSMLGEMLAGITAADGMGAEIACGLTEVELRWMRDREWARSSDDVLWRRSKLGLEATTEDRAAIDSWWQANG